MDKQAFLAKLDSLNLDKNRYCIIAGGSMLIRGLKSTTADIDIKVNPDYFEELKTRFNFKKSPKYPYLYVLSEDVEVSVFEYDQKDVDIVDGYPLEPLEQFLAWMLKNNRPKDKEKIEAIQNYLETH